MSWSGLLRWFMFPYAAPACQVKEWDEARFLKLRRQNSDDSDGFSIQKNIKQLLVFLLDTIKDHRS